MPAKKYRVRLSQEQQEKLEELTRRGTISVRKYKRAQVLLLADENSEQGRKKDEEVAELVDTSLATVHRVRHQSVQEGLEATLKRKASSRKAKDLRWQRPSSRHRPFCFASTNAHAS